MIKLLHTADLHIGASTHILPDTYLDRQHGMLKGIKKVALKYKVDAVVISGDIFESDNPLAEEKNMFLSWLLGMDEVGFLVLAISGNHEVEELSGLTAIRDLALLSRKKKFTNVVMVERHPRLIPFNGGYFACIPWGNDINTCVKSMYKKCKDPEFFIVVGHAYVRGLKTDTGYTSGNAFTPINYKFVTAFLFGDIHRRQEFCNGKGFMCGPPIQHRWDEKLPKTVTIIDVDGGKVVRKKHVKLKGVKPLVVVNDPKDIPEDAIVKLVSMKDVDKVNLPDNVVEVSDYANEKEALQDISSFDITDGLAEYLAKKGFDRKQQRSGVKLVEAIKENL